MKVLATLGVILFIIGPIYCANQTREGYSSSLGKRDTCSSVNVQQCFQAFSDGLNAGTNDCDLIKALVDCASEHSECTSDHITKGRAIAFLAGRMRKAGQCNNKDIALSGLSSLVVGTVVGNAIGLTDGSAGENDCVANVDTTCMNVFHTTLTSSGLCSALQSLTTCIPNQQCTSPVIQEMTNALAHQSIVSYLQTSELCV